MTILVVILLLVTLGALPPGPTAEAGTTTPRRLWARCTHPGHPAIAWTNLRGARENKRNLELKLCGARWTGSHERCFTFQTSGRNGHYFSAWCIPT